VPLYERVKQHLQERISKGEWQSGARLPSEYELVETLGASRMTVHRALREMQHEGLLRRVQGVGTFIADQPPRSALLEIADITADIIGRNHTHRAVLIALETITADAERAADFNLRKGTKLYRSEMVHFENDVPVQLEERFVLPSFAPKYLEQDFLSQSTASYLQAVAPPSELEHVIHAINPAPHAQILLQISASEPCLRLTRRTWTAIGPVTYSRLTHPGSRYSLGSRYFL
jgi:GntR family histidine utilization transcriptional repressor